MKRCPQCNRTYADDTLSFCLEDGGVLSAPYNEEEAVAFSKDYQVGHTDPNFQPDKSVATVIGKSSDTSPSQVIEAPRTGESLNPHLVYAAAGLVAVIILGIAWFAMNNSKPNETTATNSAKSVSNVVAVAPAKTATPEPTPRQISKDVSVDSRSLWTDTGITVEQGEQIKITARGSVVWDADLPAVSPDGTFPASNVQSPSDFPLPSAGCGSLVMRIGSTKYAVGSNSTVVARERGSIEFIVNDRLQSLSNNTGNFETRIEIGGTSAQAPQKGKNNVPTTRQLQDELLREAKRIEDAANR